MSTIPQGAFAALKMREKHLHNLGLARVAPSVHESKTFYSNKGMGYTPVKYNSKLMNSIWGLYNRYSVHNFKKNTDADEVMTYLAGAATQQSSVGISAPIEKAAGKNTKIPQLSVSGWDQGWTSHGHY